MIQRATHKNRSGLAFAANWHERYTYNDRHELTGADRAALVLDRHALHNELLGFTHPRTGERLELRAELPRDLAELLG